MYTTQKEIRSAFWAEYPQFKRVAGKTQNDYPTDVGVTFCDFVEMLERCGEISEKMAQKVTL